MPWYSSYNENGSGQYFVAVNAAKRAGFADAESGHSILFT